MPTLATHLLDSEQRPGGRGEGHAREARLPRLVLDAEAHVGERLRELADAVDRQPPQGGVIDLKRIVPAVLAGPKLHIVALELTCHLCCDRQQLEGAATDGGVRVGERPA